MPTPKPILTVIPCHEGDVALAAKLIEWLIAVSGGRKQPAALLVFDTAVSKPAIQLVKESARDAFENWDAIGIMCGVKRGTAASNFMLEHIATTIANRYACPWLLLEPDCVPLRATWFQELTDAYYQSAKRYLGAFIRSNDPLLPAVHLSGIAIYPADAIRELAKVSEKPRAWDIETADAVIPAAHETPLIHHFWGPSKDASPIFVREKFSDSPDNHVTLDFVKREACLFHRSKDGSLITILQRQLGAERLKKYGVPVGDPASPLTIIKDPATASTGAALPHEAQHLTPEVEQRRLAAVERGRGVQKLKAAMSPEEKLAYEKLKAETRAERTRKMREGLAAWRANKQTQQPVATP